MADAKKSGRASISKAKTIKEMGDYWDAHSLAERWDETQEASFEVRATRRRRVALDPDVYTEVEALAHLRGLSPETLVNLWIVEHLQRGKKSPKPSQRATRLRQAG